MKKARLITIFLALAVFTTVLLYFKYLSDEVTESFIQIEQRLDEEHITKQFKNDSIALVLVEGYGQASEKGRFLDSVTNQLDYYISILKKDIKQSIENDGYEAWESSGYLDALFFEGSTISQTGHEFIGSIDAYRTSVSKHFKSDFPEIVGRMETEFSTAPVVDNEGRQKNWLPYHFKGFPLVASMTKLTQMQSNLKRTQQELFLALANSEE